MCCAYFYYINMKSTANLADSEQIHSSLRNLALSYLRALKAEWGESLAAVVLFGSVARREAGACSDIDLLIIDSGLPKERWARYHRLDAVDARIEPERNTLFRVGIMTDISPILKTPDEAERLTPLYLDMLQDAEILYEKEGFFSAILDRLRHSLDRLGARRIQRGHVRYWELKPDYVPSEEFTI